MSELPKLKKSPNDLSVLFQQILKELSEILMTESTLSADSKLISWDLSDRSHRERISEMLVAGMKGTSGWTLRLGDTEHLYQNDRLESVE